MTTFDDRERAFEAKFAHDAEMQFRAVARRDRLLGLWAAGLMGKSGEAAEAYAREIVRSDVQGKGEEDLYGRLAADLGDRADEATIRDRMRVLLAQAKAQVLDEVEPG